MLFVDGDPREIRRKLNEMVAIWEDALVEAVGPSGWSPVFAVVSDGSRRVLQITDWVGGEGTKPVTTGYIGPSGIVSIIEDAVDIRGPAGSAGNLAWDDITDKPSVIAAGATTTEAKTAISLQHVDNTSDIDKPVSTATQTALDGKVDKITGKGLSTEDYTSTEKTKLAGIAEGATANTGTVTSVDLSAPIGLTVGGSPVTSSGTLALTFTAGYSIPTDASQTNWNTAFGWGNHATAGYLTVNPTLGTPVSGNLSNCTVDGTNKIGFKNIPQNSQSAAYTLVASDAGKHILHPSADTTARTYTIPANSSVPYPIGTAITFVNQNGTGGVVTIAIATDTMRLAGAGTTGSRTLARNGVATALKIAATEWIISGSGLT